MFILVCIETLCETIVLGKSVPVSVVLRVLHSLFGIGVSQQKTSGISITTVSAPIQGEPSVNSELPRYSVFCCLRVSSYGASQISGGTRNA